MANIHEQALRTAARISFTLGALGCAEDITDPEPVEGDAGVEEDGAAGEVDVGFVEVPDGALPDAVLVFPEDAGSLADGDFLADAWTEDAEPAEPDAGETTDAGFPCEHLQAPEDWEERAKCCEEIGWDPQVDPSCTPWGPPVPPAMPGAVK